MGELGGDSTGDEDSAVRLHAQREVRSLGAERVDEHLHGRRAQGVCGVGVGWHAERGDHRGRIGGIAHGGIRCAL